MNGRALACRPGRLYRHRRRRDAGVIRRRQNPAGQARILPRRGRWRGARACGWVRPGRPPAGPGPAPADLRQPRTPSDLHRLRYRGRRTARLDVGIRPVPPKRRRGNPVPGTPGIGLGVSCGRVDVRCKMRAEGLPSGGGGGGGGGPDTRPDFPPGPRLPHPAYHSIIKYRTS